MNDCSSCEALRHLDDVPTLAPDIIVELKADHQFAQHARQTDMFNVLMPAFQKRMAQFKGNMTYTEEELRRSLDEIQKTPGDRMIVLPADEAIMAREDGIAQADKGSPQGFKDAAQDAIRRVASTEFNFLVDEIWSSMPDEWKLGKPRVKGVWMGAEVRKASKAVIRNTGRLKPSKNKRGHASRRTVWESRLIDNPELARLKMFHPKAIQYKTASELYPETIRKDSTYGN